MAITSTITDNLSDSQKPSASHSPTTITPLTGDKGIARFSTSITATGNVDADPETAYTNVETALKTWVDGTFLPSTIKLDTAASITAVIYVETMDLETSDKWSDDGKDYAVTGRVEWQ